MDNLLTLASEAHNAELNHHRRYEVVLGQDLLDDWTVAIRYGRVGQGGRLLREAQALKPPRPARWYLSPLADEEGFLN